MIAVEYEPIIKFFSDIITFTKIELLILLAY
jgi:hypothetical protein